MTDRRGEIAANLADVRRRVATAVEAAGRTDEVTVIAVTKTWPAADVRHLADLGVRDIGENRDQEARQKHEACADLDLRWHFVGQLQRNKAASVVSYADVVHSVDRNRLVAALDRAAGAAGRRLTALVQVSLEADPDPERGGVPPAAAADLAAAIAAAGNLDLGGVMAVAPLAADADAAFGRLADIAAAIRADHPGATMVSAGMSGDLEAAVRRGATHLRIGTALLGPRPPVVR